MLSLFLFFPEDHECTVTELTSLWVAEGFIPDQKGKGVNKQKLDSDCHEKI